MNKKFIPIAFISIVLFACSKKEPSVISVNNKSIENKEFASDGITNVSQIYNQKLLHFTQDGRDGLEKEFVIKFDENKNLILQDDRWEVVYNSPEDEIDEDMKVEDHSTTLLKKTNKISTTENFRKNYDYLLNIFLGKADFITNNSEKTDKAWEFKYYGNQIIGPNIIFTDNKLLLGDSPIVIGTKKNVILGTLGTPHRTLDREDGYIDYSYNENVKVLGKNFYACTSIGFAFDKKDEITKIEVTAEEIEEPENDDPEDFLN